MRKIQVILRLTKTLNIRFFLKLLFQNMIGVMYLNYHIEGFICLYFNVHAQTFQAEIGGKQIRIWILLPVVLYRFLAEKFAYAYSNVDYEHCK